MGSNTSNIDDEYFDDTLTIKQLVELYKTMPSEEELKRKEEITAQEITKLKEHNNKAK